MGVCRQVSNARSERLLFIGRQPTIDASIRRKQAEMQEIIKARPIRGFAVLYRHSHRTEPLGPQPAVSKLKVAQDLKKRIVSTFNLR